MDLLDQPPIAIIVPARLGSKRFPRKLLAPIRNKPLILWTAERLCEVASAIPFYFAVAEQELAEILEKAGYKALPTDPDLPSGTDRVAAANRSVRAKRVINVQADEPLVTAEQIQRLCQRIQQPNTVMATLAAPIDNHDDFCNPNQVKVVWDRNGNALYFSRAPIPHARVESEGRKAGTPSPRGYRHLGLYAYTASFLEEFCRLPRGHYEQQECLEQLRALENGFAIAVERVRASGIGIDTPTDLKQFIVHTETS